MNHKTAIIGITGRKRSGKDAIYKALASNGLGGVIRVAFADPLKQELAKACGVALEFIDQHKEEFRPGLQWWGTGFRRRFYGEDYWVKQAMDQLRKAIDFYKPFIVVITDCRFPNECQVIKDMGGKIWRVERPGLPQGDLHISETALDGFQVDRVIRNDQSLTHLRAAAMVGVMEDFGVEVLCVPH